MANGVKVFIVGLLLILSVGLAGQNKTNTEALSEENKIEYLINKVEQLDSAVFIRNGATHSAKEAAKHLRMKRNKAGKRIKTVNDFIEKVGSKSSISNKAYQIKFNNGEIVSAESFYRHCLKKLESE